jgi:hypothetical protein
MIDLARRRNRKCVEQGRAAFDVLALHEAGTLSRRFDKAFAINVGLFRERAKEDAAVLRALLRSDGRFYSFQQHPTPERTRAATAELLVALEQQRFAVVAVERSGTGGSLLTCVVAETGAPRRSAARGAVS